MLAHRLPAQIRLMQPKLHGLAAGMTLAVGSTFLTQGCPLVGQCPSCGACLPRLPLLAVPLVVDGLVLLAGRIMERGKSLGSIGEKANAPGG